MTELAEQPASIVASPNTGQRERLYTRALLRKTAAATETDVDSMDCNISRLTG